MLQYGRLLDATTSPAPVNRGDRFRIFLRCVGISTIKRIAGDCHLGPDACVTDLN
jgi:hypothetical protein